MCPPFGGGSVKNSLAAGVTNSGSEGVILLTTEEQPAKLKLNNSANPIFFIRMQTPLQVRQIQQQYRH